MGFEVYYHYNEKLEGCYEKGETKVLKKRVGDPFEDVPLEKLASSITSQLARRDILISDVEIYELSKKSVSFKETKNGIIIKNKKFLFDVDSIIVQDLSCSEQENKEVSSLCVQGQSVDQVCPHNSIKNTRTRVVDNVTFSPEPHQIQEIKSKNLKLTLGKKYEVFDKKSSPNNIGELYLLKDDKNKEQWVSDLYFVPASINLFGDKELGFSSGTNKSDEPKLLWDDSSVDSSMPNIRRM